MKSQSNSAYSTSVLMPNTFNIDLLTKPKSAILFFLKLYEYVLNKYDKSIFFPFKSFKPKRFKMCSTFCFIQKKSFLIFFSFQHSDFSFPHAIKISFFFSIY